jgi:hypothetical protein
MDDRQFLQSGLFGNVNMDRLFLGFSKADLWEESVRFGDGKAD